MPINNSLLSGHDLGFRARSRESRHERLSNPSGHLMPVLRRRFEVSEEYGSELVYARPDLLAELAARDYGAVGHIWLGNNRFESVYCVRGRDNVLVWVSEETYRRITA